jgi:hypothetical protein
MTPLTRAKLVIGAFFLAGLAVLVYGTSGLLGGRIEISVKGGANVVLKASDPDSGWFFGYVWLCITVGVILVACSAFAAFELIFGKQFRRQRIIQAVCTATNRDRRQN